MVQIAGIDVNNKTEIKIIFSQADKNVAATTEQIIRDKNGNTVKFSNMDDTLKFFQRDGYIYVSTFTYTFDDKKVKQYLLQKKMQKELKYKIGDGISVTTGPLNGIYGTIIFFD